MENLFRNNYRSVIKDDFEDDFIMFKSVKRTINSYIKNPNTDKLHSIYNRIFILRRVFHEQFLYEQLMSNNDNDNSKNLMCYFIAESFGHDMNCNEDAIDDLWTIQISDLLENTKIRTED